MTKEEKEKLARLVARVAYLQAVVKGMRVAQKNYFATRSDYWLEIAKLRERNVDIIIDQELVWR